MTDSQILIYQTEDGNTQIDVRLENDTVWLNQAQISTLFQRERSVITKHINNVFDENELALESNVQFLHIANSDKPVKVYSLNAIISVGYRVKSHRGTQFRIWATQRLKEYIIKGFTIDDERLKAAGQIRYFDELVERIRDIRSSERIFYQKVKDIFTLSIDYDPKTNHAKDFFATVQNKLHWAIHQHTAAELIAIRANANEKNMGLTAWQGAKIRKTDAIIAKNYLSEPELSQLNLLVEQFLAFAENQARQKKVMYMSDWIKKLNDILIINENEILEHTGKISHELALEIAETEYEKYNQQRIVSDDLKSLENLSNELKQLGKKH